MPISDIGVMLHVGPRCPGTDRVWPLATMVQVTLSVSLKSLGTFTVNTPHCRRGMKKAGWPDRGRLGQCGY